MGMMKFLGGMVVLLVALGAHAQSPPATGTPTADTTELKRHFENGSKAFNLGEFKHAVEEYKAAYNIRADPVFLYNIAQAYRLDGNLAQALFFYKGYLNNSPKAPNRKEVESRIRELDRQISEQKAVTTAPPNTTATPSGVSSTEPEPRPSPTTEPPATTPPTTTPPPAATATPSTTPGGPELVATAPPKKTPIYKKWWLWTAVGVVVVGAAVGIGLGVGLQSGAPGSALGATRVF